MKAGGGKLKGGEFERDVCKKLSLWLSDGKNQNLLWRSAMSGGRATIQLRKGDKAVAQSGDISAISEEAFAFINAFSVECKSYKDIYLQNMVWDGKEGMPYFWQQTYDAAESSSKFPILIAKQNRRKEIICLDRRGRDMFTIPMRARVYWSHDPTMSLVGIYQFSEFIDRVDPKSLKTGALVGEGIISK